MKAAICWGKKIIMATTTTADQSRMLPRSRPRAAHCLARCCCQNPRPIRATESPKSHGCSLVKKALATPVPSAAAKPRGRQQLMLATELKIAANDADTPVCCLICHPLFHCAPLHVLRSPHGEPIQPWEGRSVTTPDINGNSMRRYQFRTVPQHLVR